MVATWANSLLVAKMAKNNISMDNVDVQSIPGLSEPTKGAYDLRKGIKEYLGQVY